MKFTLASVLAALPLLASSHAIQPRSQRRVCGNENVEIPRSLKSLHDRLAANESARRPLANFSASIPTYFHIVSTTANQNMVTDQMVADQLSVLNTHYSGTGFTFNLVATDRVVNAQWAAQNNEAAMQKALRKGKYSSLNIYFLTDLPQPLLGQCNYPQANPRYVDSVSFRWRLAWLNDEEILKWFFTEKIIFFGNHNIQDKRLPKFPRNVFDSRIELETPC
jgi:hypothetical protein